MLHLRHYQQRCLDDLARYLKLAGQTSAEHAFLVVAKRPYLGVKDLANLPYVCLRVPTGGGKTLMACHAVGIAAREYLQAERGVCLWLVPSNVILKQTLNALRQREHPYRQALQSRFTGMVRPMDLAEALYLQRNVADGETVVIVSTLAALRVEDTDGRKVYEDNGSLMEHFRGLPNMLQARVETLGDGRVIHSLANVLRMRRPIVIMDEAHNARTPLSFETLRRLSPSCVLEFTATPDMEHHPERDAYASNILCHVSAKELLAEDMIKLPIKLKTQLDWKETVASALQKQRELEQAALAEEQETGEYLRPIVLFQAQPRRAGRTTLTAEFLRETLQTDSHVPPEQVKVATGETREIDDVNLFDHSCPVRYVITVQALKEGWDCSFAYVLCSVAEQHSARAVEQVLGRVLRLPYQRKKSRAELNSAYAFASSESWPASAQSLTDALVENGFQRMEAHDLVVPEEQAGLFGDEPLFPQAAEPVTQPPALGHLPEPLQQRVSFEPHSQTLQVVGELDEADQAALRSCFTQPADRAAVDRLAERSRGRAVEPASPAARPALQVPLLGIRIDGQLELFDETFLESDWDLATCDAVLSENEFSTQVRAGTAGEVSVTEAGKLYATTFATELQQQLTLIGFEPGWSLPGLVNWLDRQFDHPDIPQAQSCLFIHRALTGLIEGRGLTMEQLAQAKFRLRNALEAKIDQYRQAARRHQYQSLLFGREPATLEVDPELVFTFEPDRYAPSWEYSGPYRFRKHFCPRVGELKSDGEEFDCACFLDGLEEIECWIRNIERRPDSSFWLQTATDRFYPDFVARMRDGRILVVEFKGADRWSTDDSKENRAVGDLGGGAQREAMPFRHAMRPGLGGDSDLYLVASVRLRRHQAGGPHRDRG